jgi:uncharacterized protein (TIGR03067 family)
MIKILVPLLTMTALSLAVGDDSAKPDAERLPGVWNCVSAIRDGKPLPEETVKALRLTLTTDKYKTELGQQVLFESTYRVDAAKKPKQIDIIGTEGANAGKSGQGIYLLEGNQFTLCHTMPGQERPTEFVSKPGSGVTLAVWKRSP